MCSGRCKKRNTHQVYTELDASLSNWRATSDLRGSLTLSNKLFQGLSHDSKSTGTEVEPEEIADNAVQFGFATAISVIVILGSCPCPRMRIAIGMNGHRLVRVMPT
jgi:hypothetical protein